MGKRKDTKKKKGGGGGGQGQGDKGSRAKKVEDAGRDGKQRKKAADSGASCGKRGKKKVSDAAAIDGVPPPRITKKRGSDDGSSGSDRNVKQKSSSSEEERKLRRDDGTHVKEGSPISEDTYSPVTQDSVEGEIKGSPISEDTYSPVTQDSVEGEINLSDSFEYDINSPVTESHSPVNQDSSPVTPGYTIYRKEAYERSNVTKWEPILRPGQRRIKDKRSPSEGSSSGGSQQPIKDKRSPSEGFSSETFSSGGSRSSSQVTPGKSFADAAKDLVFSGSSIGHGPNPVPRVHRQSKHTSLIKQPAPVSSEQPTAPLKQPVSAEQPAISKQRTAPPPIKQLVTDQSVTDDFVSFLTHYIAPGEKKPYYPIELKGLKDRCCYELKVHFQDILKHDKELALEILKRTHVIDTSVKRFVTEQKFASEVEVAQKVSAIMFQMPNTMIPLKDLLKDRDNLLTLVKDILGLKGESVTVLTEVAQALLTGFLTDIRDHHNSGHSWNGEYDINDMFVVDDCEFKIIKQPYACGGPGGGPGAQKFLIPDDFFHTKTKEDPFSRAMAADVKKLEQIFSTVLLVDKKGETVLDAAIPLFYDSLQKVMLNVKPGQVKDQKFWDYVLNHPALKMSVIRSSFIILMRTLIEEKEHLSLLVQEILKEEWGDWRNRARHSAVLKDVYDYQAEEEKKKRSEEEKKKRSEEERKRKSEEEKKKRSEEEKKKRSEEEKKKSEEEKKSEEDIRSKVVSRPPFEKNLSGLVVFNRHFLQHANRVVSVFDATQIEVFFSSKFKYLPFLLKKLIHVGAFDQDSRFYHAWRLYSSYRAQLSTRTNNNSVRTLSFWWTCQTEVKECAGQGETD